MSAFTEDECLSNFSYAPIEEHGLIGNLRTAALISTNATIDWFCYPDFDSPSIFGSILDKKIGGFFSIRTVSGGKSKVKCKQFYHPDTNVLVHRFLSNFGVGQVSDFMPLGVRVDEFYCKRDKGWIVREVMTIRGKLCFEVDCSPSFDYGKHPALEIIIKDRIVVFKSEKFNMILLTSAEINWKIQKDNRGVVGNFNLNENERQVFFFREACPKELGFWDFRQDKTHLFNMLDSLKTSTLEFWHKWISKCKYMGRWRESVRRSALVLKLLTYEPTGAIVAAVTCSLPEFIGGTRNWDYRFCWIRDSSFVLYAFLRLGFTQEANAFINWIEARCEGLEGTDRLQIMYGIRGETILNECELDHLEGYMNSNPVRIGNAAFNQLQLDIYGELIDTIYIADKHADPISYNLWKHLKKLLLYVCDNWKLEDEGIWEVRGNKKHFLYSKLMCWVALDRGIKIAEKRSFPGDIMKWRYERDAIYEEIMSKGWSEIKQSFVQSYDSISLDASILIMPLMLFNSPTDPKFLKTLDAILANVSDGGLVSNSLVFRYNVEEVNDGVFGEEGSFTMCTFWAVEALARAGRYRREYLEKARLMFEQTMLYANHLGLYSEEIGNHGEALGNFPQAFAHLSLISAAFNLDKALDL